MRKAPKSRRWPVRRQVAWSPVLMWGVGGSIAPGWRESPLATLKDRVSRSFHAHRDHPRRSDPGRPRAVGLRRRHSAGTHVCQGRRADLLQVAASSAIAPTMFAPMSLTDLRGGAAVGCARSSSASPRGTMPPWGADTPHGAFKQRSASDATRKSTPSPRGSTAARRGATISRHAEDAGVRRRLDDRQARRDLHDERGVQDSGRPGRCRISISAMPMNLHRRQAGFTAIEIKPERARARAPRDRVSPQPAGDEPIASRRRSGRPTSAACTPNKPGLVFEPGVAQPAARQLRHHPADALHDQRQRPRRSDHGSAFIFAKQPPKQVARRRHGGAAALRDPGRRRQRGSEGASPSSASDTVITTSRRTCTCAART